MYPDVRDVLSEHLLHTVTSLERFYISCFGLDPNSDPDYIEVEEEEEWPPLQLEIIVCSVRYFGKSMKWKMENYAFR